MSNSSTKREQALEACDKVINGIEDGTISVSSSLLLCKKIARLVNDLEGMEWLDYEYGGYPNKKGYHLMHGGLVLNMVGYLKRRIKKDESVNTCSQSFVVK